MGVFSTILFVLLIGAQQGLGRPPEKRHLLIQRIAEHERSRRSTILCSQLKDDQTDQEITDGCITATELVGRTKALDLSALDSTQLGAFMDPKKTIKIPLLLKNSSSISFTPKKWKSNKQNGIDVEAIDNDALKTFSLEKVVYIKSLKLKNNIALESFELPKVKDVQNLLEVEGNSKLAQIDLPQAKTIQKLVVNKNQLLASIKFPLTEYIKEISVEENEQLAELLTPEVTEIKVLKVNKNSKLLKISFDELEGLADIQDPTIQIQNNDALSSIQFPKLAVFHGTTEISQNPSLKEVKLGSVTALSDFNPTGIEISSNPLLETIDLTFPSASTTEKLKNIKIRGNTKLTQGSIDNLNGICDDTCSIQGLHECVFSAPVTNLGDLNECQNIFGNLEIASTVTGDRTATSKILKIEGDLTITSTALTVAKLGFLEGVKVTGDIVIKDNTKMCDGQTKLDQMFINTGGTKTIEANPCPTVASVPSRGPGGSTPVTQTTPSGSHHLSGISGNEDDSEGEGRGQGLIITVAVISVVLLVIGITIIIFMLVKNKKKKESEKKIKTEEVKSAPITAPITPIANSGANTPTPQLAPSPLTPQPKSQ